MKLSHEEHSLLNSASCLTGYYSDEVYTEEYYQYLVEMVLELNKYQILFGESNVLISL